MWEKLNRYESQQHKRAKAKKERAKIKHFWLDKVQNDNIWWNNIDFKPHKWIAEWIISSVKGETITILDLNKQKEMEWLLNNNIPKSMLYTFVVWDIVYYESINWYWIIKKRKDRKSFISRMRGDSTRIWVLSEQEHILAANIDIALIIAPIKDPLFHPNLVDRYLIICQNWGVDPVICLNKVDLSEERPEIINWYKNNWIRVIELSTITWTWLNELRSLLKWKIWVLLWKSWVWKSSIINYFDKEKFSLRTQDVNKKSWEWKHTTTSTELYQLWNESYVIDTPWIRSLWLNNISRSELKYYFPEFKEFDSNCKYNDCSHSHEPNCWIKVALWQWKINQLRYDSYIRILEDLTD